MSDNVIGRIAFSFRLCRRPIPLQFRRRRHGRHSAGKNKPRNRRFGQVPTAPMSSEHRSSSACPFSLQATTILLDRVEAYDQCKPWRWPEQTRATCKQAEPLGGANFAQDRGREQLTLEETVAYRLSPVLCHDTLISAALWLGTTHE